MVPSLSSKKSISRLNGKVSNGIPETSKILQNVVELFNQALKPIPYDDFSENTEKNGEVRGEYWYRSLFVMLLTATGLISYPEVHISDGCPSGPFQRPPLSYREDREQTPWADLD